MSSRISAIRVHCRHPEMKRLLCSCCNMILWPPLTATVAFKKKIGVTVTCSTCRRSRCYKNRNTWMTEHGANVPSDWLFNPSPSQIVEEKKID